MKKTAPLKTLKPVGSFWHGQSLGIVHWLCLSSMVKNGHDVALYSYGELPVPAGVMLKDAAEIMPKEYIFYDRKRKSIAPFSDIFRLEMIRQTGRMWMDTDVLLTRPYQVDEEMLFWGVPPVKGKRLVANSILSFPENSPILDEMLALIYDPAQLLKIGFFTQTIEQRIKRLKLRLGRLLTGRWQYERMTWGILGGILLIHLLKEHNLEATIMSPNDKRYRFAKYALFLPEPYLPQKIKDTMAFEFGTAGLAKRNIDFYNPIEGSVYAWACQKYDIDPRAFKELRKGG